MDADSQWYNSLYGNIGQIASGLSAIGRENAQHNMLSDLAAQGAYGVMNPDQPFASNWVQWKQGADKTGATTKAANGGRIKRHKRGGLTI